MLLYSAVVLPGLLCAEIHVCGESSAINLVERLVSSCNDELEVSKIFCTWQSFSSLETNDCSTTVR